MIVRKKELDAYTDLAGQALEEKDSFCRSTTSGSRVLQGNVTTTMNSSKNNHIPKKQNSIFNNSYSANSGASYKKQTY